jgi:hypothetical protein
MARIRLGSVGLDCADPGPLSAFWAEMLGGEIAVISDNVVVVKLDHLWLTAYRVEDYKPPTWPQGPVPKQAHIDLDVDDLDESEKRAVFLGAVRAQLQPEPESYLVLLDPAGHPFCLTTQFPK